MKKLVKITIADLQFADLKLKREPDGAVTFDKEVIMRICADSGIDPSITLSDEDNVAGIIVAWYAEHRAAGGDADPVADDLITETLAEDDHGGGLSHPPGRA